MNDCTISFSNKRLIRRAWCSRIHFTFRIERYHHLQIKLSWMTKSLFTAFSFVFYSIRSNNLWKGRVFERLLKVNNLNKSRCWHVSKLLNERESRSLPFYDRHKLHLSKEESSNDMKSEQSQQVSLSILISDGCWHKVNINTRLSLCLWNINCTKRYHRQDKGSGSQHNNLMYVRFLYGWVRDSVISYKEDCSTEPNGTSALTNVLMMQVLAFSMKPCKHQQRSSSW